MKSHPQFYRSAAIIAGSIFLSCAIARPTLAQLIPDTTLGAENSVITPIDLLNQRIDGGAARGINLFHSFLEFNIGNGSSVYFANPAGIENILTRVTGNNASNILGTLGVLGNANLFLINPNGIYFGENARLDVSGSFLATTADGIQLGTQGYFSATDPQNSQLLSVQPSALFSNALRNWTSEIKNEGNLAVGGNLTLIADELDLKGQLSVGGNLTLVGANLVNSPWNLQTNSQQTPSTQGTLQIRDSATNPFIAAAGGELLVQGNETVDIFALNHPDSGLFSGGDMVLRSGNQVSGDAHYYAGGSFRIEQLDGNLGDLFSPFDPVIRALGDVTFDVYGGASLHILAGGQVNIGSVIIFGADTVGDSINPTSTPDLANVTLSNGQSITIDGNARPTLDIRAGMNPGDIGIPGITGANGFFLDSAFNSAPVPNLTNPATGSSITIGSILFNAPGGTIFLTNQFRPNLNLTPGTIQVTNNPNQPFFNSIVSPGTGGDVILDSRAGISIERTINVSAATVGGGFTGTGGNVALLAQDNISLAPSTQGISILSAGQSGGNIRLESNRDVLVRGRVFVRNNTLSSASSTGGDITVRARSLSLTDGAALFTSTEGLGNTGRIDIDVSQTLSADGEDSLGNSGGIYNLATSRSIGNAGDVRIAANAVFLINGATINSFAGGQGNTSNIEILATESFTSDGVNSLGLPSGVLNNTANGNGGNLTVRTNSLNLTNGAALRTATTGAGNAGAINITVSKIINADGESSRGNSSGISSLALSGATGNAGDIYIGANGLHLANGSAIFSSSLGQGSSGNLNIAVARSFTADGTTSQRFLGGVFNNIANGKGGDINIQANSVKLTNGASLSSLTLSAVNSSSLNRVDNSSPLTQASAGAISIQAAQTFEADGESPFGSPSGVFTGLGLAVAGNAGDINIWTNTLRFTNGAGLNSSTAGRGNAGQISITATDTVIFDGETRNGNLSSGITSLVAPGAIGDGGQVSITTNSLAVINGAFLGATTLGLGNGGSFEINATDLVFVDGQSLITTSSLPGAIGNSGEIDISAQTITLSNQGNISTLAAGQGRAGNINIRSSSLSLNRSTINASTLSGAGGNINLGIGEVLVMRDNSFISTTAGLLNAGGNGGNIDISAQFIVGIPLENSDITANAFNGRGGNITITTNGIFGLKFRPRLTPLSDITASSEFGVNGTFNLNRLSFPSEQGLNELPSSLVDAESAFARDVCGIQDGKIAGGSSLTITGRGGMPPSPLEPLTPLNGSVEWSRRNGNSGENETARPAAILRDRSRAEADESGNPKEIRPAQGWRVTPEGRVLLTAEVPAPGAFSVGWVHPDCTKHPTE
ncbi:filamentous hemagglutinin N-terminal domain-containing protein [Lusitaniella coriacea]|uniref:two-partner secretion domain-containing protein n=1 Tax=Lusitaniella coriacea TaxID=1983105 RepID=UPI003CEB0B0D